MPSVIASTATRKAKRRMSTCCTAEGLPWVTTGGQRANTTPAVSTSMGARLPAGGTNTPPTPVRKRESMRPPCPNCPQKLRSPWLSRARSTLAPPTITATGAPLQPSGGGSMLKLRHVRPSASGQGPLALTPQPSACTARSTNPAPDDGCAADSTGSQENNQTPSNMQRRVSLCLLPDTDNLGRFANEGLNRAPAACADRSRRHWRVKRSWPSPGNGWRRNQRPRRSARSGCPGPAGFPPARG